MNFDRSARWAHLLDEDPVFRRWYENLARGSEWTARGRARDLYRFLRKHDMTPGDLIELSREDRRRAEELLMDFIAGLHAEGYSPIGRSRRSCGRTSSKDTFTKDVTYTPPYQAEQSW